MEIIFVLSLILLAFSVITKNADVTLYVGVINLILITASMIFTFSLLFLFGSWGSDGIVTAGLQILSYLTLVLLITISRFMYLYGKKENSELSTSSAVENEV